MRTRVLIADDHAILRESLAAILRREPDLEVLAEVTDGEEALQMLRRVGPELAILDVQMPRMTGIEVVRKARELKLRTQAIVLSMHHETAYVRAALQAGALGYVVKEAALAELLQAVRMVRSGQIFISSALNLNPLEILRGSEGEERPLTPRERDVLRLLAQGLSSKEIASRLDLSVRTVDGRRAAIMEKLDVRSVPGLVKYAIKHHLAEVDD